MKKLLPLILLGLTAFLIIPGYANWGGGETGNLGTGNFRAFGTHQVELVKELLNIELYSDTVQVSVEYIFHNTGEAVTVKAGFPSLAGTIYDDQKNQNPESLEIYNYQIKENGQELPYDYESGGKVTWTKIWDPDEMAETYPSIYWLVSTVDFKKDESKTILITYNSNYERYSEGVSDDTDYGSQNFYYFLSTGAAWKGPIQSGTVTIDPVAVNPEQLSIKPNGRFKKDGRLYTWSFSNLKPSLEDNISIDLNNDYSVKTFYLENGGMVQYLVDGKKYYFDFKNYKVAASSTLQGGSYGAQNVLDDDPATAWIEGAKGDGVGESLLLTLNKPTKVSQVGIMGGYGKSKNIYFANNRVAELKVVINDSYTITRSLYDAMTLQFLDVGNYSKEVKTIKLMITKIYKGTKYDDTCISEIVIRTQLDKVPAGHGAR